ncbi:polysaccharide biosynthesis/export family protein [Flavobacterium sp. MAH-1]|uniref:Polysaccharide biosynthesis/export family protein n=1 Tax=Flavobacterium agri TaxID=2743471 RepID=A0A7Y9C6Z6_9FLAO|nr:polysaccharide biosynthesis/export family protein [Flavobacterium agri]NUY80884.1 polysaccharide biosynthesis/export family protein [Flavobacterium agri]NYA70908.1 polysaccharide biosynthesis/export family protein [Flavobacterium agri]
MLRFKGVFVLLFLVIATSCATRKDIAYMQDADNAKQSQLQNYEPTLKPDDLLSIIVSAETPEVTVPFNLPAIQGNYQVDNNQNGIKTYLIDNFGNIDFPVIGKVQLGGLTRTEAVNKLTRSVSEYITNPSINLRILNYKVSVLGEVSKPGSFTVPSERITLLEALSNAGDLTIYGKRNNILVIREAEGKKSFTRVDITNTDFVNSPYYYLSQNDVIVVEPNNTRVKSSSVGPNTTLYISVASILVTIATIVILR